MQALAVLRVKRTINSDPLCHTLSPRVEAVPPPWLVAQDRDRPIFVVLTLLMIQDSRLVHVLARQGVTQVLLHTLTMARVVVMEAVAQARTLHNFFLIWSSAYCNLSIWIIID
ncbi:MAG: hypothetical protein DLM72_21360 [Candidatus Nitrosopolaris wilkensis]|nr:MAG: hypothetical protein DLM72_21360 [Candidatus Nitrosopolaris wilkensis]